MRALNTARPNIGHEPQVQAHDLLQNTGIYEVTEERKGGIIEVKVKDEEDVGFSYGSGKSNAKRCLICGLIAILLTIIIAFIAFFFLV